ncbi:hypothetical protein O0544_08380 [Edwardsiella anguillarum]|nr:hypothetical protein [Edwardsiella anguillarum]
MPANSAPAQKMGSRGEAPRNACAAGAAHGVLPTDDAEPALGM